MNIADVDPMKTGFTAFSAFLLFLMTAGGCSSPFAGDTLVAVPVEGKPTVSDWERAVPLDLTVWRGNVKVPEDIVTIDSETSHRSTPECHHGPSTSDPVRVRMRALYTTDDLYLLLEWSDKSRDMNLGTWERGPEGWAARPGADDGIAILWEPPGSGVAKDPFRCQSTCHMMEVDVYDGSTKMKMGMKAPSGRLMDLWRWRASVTGTHSVADDMVVDDRGKRGDEGQVLLRENRPAREPGREESAVSGRSPTVLPLYTIEAPRGRQSHVQARGSWKKGTWHLLLSRALNTDDPDDIAYGPGARVPFSISVFDNTFSEHHVSETSALLVLWQDAGSPAEGRDLDEPFDF